MNKKLTPQQMAMHLLKKRKMIKNIDWWNDFIPIWDEYGYVYGRQVRDILLAIEERQFDKKRKKMQ